MAVASLVLGIIGFINSIFLVGNVFVGFWLVSIGLIDVSVVLSNLEGLFGACLGAFLFIVLISSILAVIFGILAIRKNTPNKHLAQAGLVLGIVVFLSLLCGSILMS